MPTHEYLDHFVVVQTAASRQDVLGALEVLFQESPEALAPGAHPRVPQSNVQLKQQVLELDSMFAILGQQPYAGSPAMRWDPSMLALLRQARQVLRRWSTMKTGTAR
jgi:hypothetical protein